MDVPILLYRGMSESEYNEAKASGRFSSAQLRYENIRQEIELDEQALEYEHDPEIRAELEQDIEMWEADLQSRELSGEFNYTFWADTYSEAAAYGPVVVTIRTQGIEGLFEPFRPGEWVSTEPVPFSAMHGAQLQLHRTQFETRALRRPDVRVHRHQRRLIY